MVPHEGRLDRPKSIPPQDVPGIITGECRARAYLTPTTDHISPILTGRPATTLPGHIPRGVAAISDDAGGEHSQVAKAAQQGQTRLLAPGRIITRTAIAPAQRSSAMIHFPIRTATIVIIVTTCWSFPASALQNQGGRGSSCPQGNFTNCLIQCNNMSSDRYKRGPTYRCLKRCERFCPD